MRTRPSHILTFLLPQGARRDDGIRVDSRYGEIVEIGRSGLITVMAPSQEAAFEIAAQMLRIACRGLAPLSIAARIYAPALDRGDGRDWLEVPGPADGWTIIVGADVAFSPTQIDPYFPGRMPVAAKIAGRG